MSNVLRFAVMTLALTVPLSASDHPIMPISEIEKGMTGYGLTVFEGTEPERFEVEIVGILENIGPNRNIILARIASAVTDESGVVAGMSGSPIYIDDRLIGALAYSWMFSKAPVAGITPIEEMSPGASAAVARSGPTEISAAEFANALAEPDYASLQPLFQKLLPQGMEAMGGAVPLPVPLSMSNFSPSTIERFSSAFASTSFLPVPSGSRAGSSVNLEGSDLRPGDPMAAVLISGDFSVAATGTVTRVDGEDVAGFGHPFLHMGPVEFPMARAEIVTVLPSMASSFKLSNTGGIVGALTQDRYSGIYGTLGRTAAMIPMSFEVSGGDAAQWSFDVEAVDHPQLLPLLLALTADNVLTTTRQGSGEQSIFIEYEIGVKGRNPIRIREGWSGPSARQSIPAYLAVVSGYLLTNEFEHVDIESIDVRITHDENPRIVRVVEANYVEPRDGVINPGDVLRLDVLLRDYRGETRRETVEIEVPDSVTPGPAYLFVGSGSMITRLDFSLVPPAPRTFAQVVEVLERLRPSTDLAVALYAPAAGLVQGGAYLPDLPPSIQAVTAAERGTTNGAQVQYHPAREEVRSLDQVVVGAHRLDLTVEQK